MKSDILRKKFLDYFHRHGHKIVAGSSLVPADPTLLLTAAGMVQFKPIFLGKIKVDYTRAASVQKCVRTTDIEQVGHTARHLTFFEMFGNFSFGDYYKQEASQWAWEFLTKELGLSSEKLWVTVFETDEEAVKIWRDDVGVAEDRIVRLGEKDNFWSAGPTGPCGPCSEVLYDLGPERGCDRPKCAVGCDCDRYLELWNLVFMQYNRDEKGELHPLPKKNIDTGMGLERIASVLQGTETNFEIDIIKPIIDIVAGVAKVKYGEDDKIDISLKVIVDHLRAVTFMAGDGIMPANEGRGYILRRLVRRAVRHGRLLGIKQPFAVKVVDMIVKLMSGFYPELKEKEAQIRSIIVGEEERFSYTLKQGLAILDKVISDTKSNKLGEIPGLSAFKLYDTYGFPLELTIEIAGESGLKVDVNSFNQLMFEQRDRARAEAAATAGHARIYVGNIYPKIIEKYGKSDFTGYETEEVEAEIVAISANDVLIETAKPGDKVEIFLDHTPFYAEKGGQIGDIGIITAETGKAQVLDTSAPLAELIAHKVKVTEGMLKTGQTVNAIIDKRRRRSISRNHTATHLLQWALRIILGEHVSQAGSFVGADRLRFDFTHHQPLSPKDISNVQRLVNEKILQNHPVRTYITTFDYAKDIGATALFEEKYGKYVRVVEIGDFSKELCGGVHLGTTSEVGFLKIISVSSIGANSRRIEAITGEKFLDHYRLIEKELKRISTLLGVKEGQSYPAVADLKKQAAKAKKELSSLRYKQLEGEVGAIIANNILIKDISLLTHTMETATMDELRVLADRLRSLDKSSVVVLAAANNGKATLLVAAAPAIVKSGFSSVAMLKKLAPLIGGGGGGRADLAQAGGKDAAGIVKLFPAAKKFIEDFYHTRA